MTETKRLTVEELDKIIHRLRCDKPLASGDIDAIEHAAREAIVAREVLEQYRADVLSALATVNTIDALGGDYPTRTEASLKQRDLEQRLRIINAALSPPPSTVEGDGRCPICRERSDPISPLGLCTRCEDKRTFGSPPEDQPDKIAELCERLREQECASCRFDDGIGLHDSICDEAATALREQAAIIRWKDTEISIMAEIARELITERDEAQAEIARLREALEEIAALDTHTYRASVAVEIASAALGGKE